jgi:hypothetical protein
LIDEQLSNYLIRLGKRRINYIVRFLYYMQDKAGKAGAGR